MTIAKSLAGAYDRVWTAFQEAGTTEDGRHDTPQWRAHHGPYAACVIRINHHGLQPELNALRDSLESLPGVRLHPDHFLHIMLQELGFVVEQPTRSDELTAARLEEFAQAAIEPIASTPSFAIAVGGANAFQDAVFLEIRGSEAVAHLHARLFDLAANPRAPDFPYLPHCTVAHFTGATPAADAAAAIAPWRGQTFGEFTISEVEIVTLDPAQAYPILESYAVIPLGG